MPVQGCTLAWLITAALLYNSIAAGTATPTPGQDPLQQNQTAEQYSTDQLQPGGSAGKQASVLQVTANGSESQADATVPSTGIGLHNGAVQSGPQAIESPYPATASSDPRHDDAVQGLELPHMDVTGSDEHEGVEPTSQVLLAAAPEHPAEPLLQRVAAVNTPESSEVPPAGSDDLQELQREHESEADTQADQDIEAQQSHGGAGQAAAADTDPQSNMQNDQHEAAHTTQGLQQQNTEGSEQPLPDTFAGQGFVHNGSEGADVPQTLPGTINHTAPSSSSSSSSNNSSSSSSSSNRETWQATLAAHKDTHPAGPLGEQQHSEQTTSMPALAAAVLDVLRILQNMATSSQHSTDRASNPPEELTQAEAAKDATSPAKVADRASGAARLTGQAPSAATTPEMQRFTSAVLNALEALQSMQPSSSTPAACSSTQQQEHSKASDSGAMAAAHSSMAGMQPETAGPSVVNTTAKGDSQEGIASAAQMVPQHASPGPLPTDTTDGRAAPAAAVQAAQAMIQAAELLEHKLLVQSVAELQHLTETLASLLNTLQHLQRGSVTAIPAHNSTEHKALSSAADSTVGIASWGTAAQIHGLGLAPRQQQPEAEFQRGEVQQLSAAVGTLLNTVRNMHQQPHAPGHSSMSAASADRSQHLQPVTTLRSKPLGGLHELPPGRYGPHTEPRWTATLQRAAQPGPHAPSSGAVSGFTVRSHKGPGSSRGPTGSGQAGLRHSDSLIAKTQQNKEGAGGSAHTCSTVVAVLRVQQQFPRCDRDQAKLDALREQVLGLVVPYFYSQAVMPDITSGILSTKCDGTSGIALIRVAIQACLEPAQQERVTCVVKYLTSIDTGNICRQIPNQCSMFAIQSLNIGRVRGALPSRVVMTPGSFALSFDPCIARLPPRYCSSHTLLPQRCKQALDSHGWSWQGQQLVREVTSDGQKTDGSIGRGKTPDVGDQTRSGGDDTENGMDATLGARQGNGFEEKFSQPRRDDSKARPLRPAEGEPTSEDTRSHDKQPRNSKHRGRPGEDAQDGGHVDDSLPNDESQAARAGDTRRRDGAQGRRVSGSVESLASEDPLQDGHQEQRGSGYREKKDRRQWDNDSKARRTNQHDPEPSTQFGSKPSSLHTSRASSHSSTRPGHTKQPQDLAALKQHEEDHASREVPADNSSMVSIAQVQEMLANMEATIAALEAAGEDVQNDPEVQEVVGRATALIAAMEAEEDKAQAVGAHAAQQNKHNLNKPQGVQQSFGRASARHQQPNWDAPAGDAAVGPSPSGSTLASPTATLERSVEARKPSVKSVAPQAGQEMDSKEAEAHTVLVNRAELQQLLWELSAVVAAAEASFAKWQA